MIKLDEDALICDLAETYQIYDYKQLPAYMVAVFSCGLRDDSRIKMKMNNQLVPLETLLMASMTDELKLLLWSKTKDAEKNRNRPEPILKTLVVSKPKETDEVAFNSSEDFEKARNRLLKGA